MLWLDLLASTALGFLGGAIGSRLTSPTVLEHSTDEEGDDEAIADSDPWVQIEYEEGGFDEGAVLFGDTDQAKLDKLVADVADSIRSRCREGVIQARKAKFDEDQGVAMSFLIRFDTGMSASYNCGWMLETWEVAKLSFESVAWYHALIEHLAQEAIECLSFAIERGQSS